MWRDVTFSARALCCLIVLQRCAVCSCVTITKYTVGGSLKIKMADGGIKRSIFLVKHDGSINFLINQKISVQEPVKVSVFQVWIKRYYRLGIEPGSPGYKFGL